MDALENTARYSVLSPKPKLPMMAASSPVTRTDAIVKISSLMPAAQVAALRRLRTFAALPSGAFASAGRSCVVVRHEPPLTTGP